MLDKSYAEESIIVSVIYMQISSVQIFLKYV